MANGGVLSWWCSAVLNYTCIMFNHASLNISPKCKEVFYLLEHSLVANKKQEVGVDRLYLIIS